MGKRIGDLGSGDVEFARDAVITDLLRDKTAFVVGPERRCEDSLEGFGRDGGLCVRRPGEEDITEVEDEGRRIRKGHDAMYEKGGGGRERGAVTGKMKGNMVKYL